ncbi:MAG: DNA alkylation repair protein [Candidatus Woesearchaeota archaeon]
MLNNIKRLLRTNTSPERASASQRFFKTGKGEYGEGDIFIGGSVPDIRKVAKEFVKADFKTIQALLNSKVHEERLCALLILVEQFKKADEKQKKNIIALYLKNTHNVNNWDLVDLSAPRILGEWLVNNDRKILYTFIKSKLLWERRIAVLATFAFIARSDFKDSMRLSELLLKDKQDLMHKAVGWMLREVGKKDKKTLETFLKKHHKVMPRTMLRYAIERFPPDERARWMK